MANGYVKYSGLGGGGGGSGGGVTSLNTLTGAVTLAAGTNITLVPVGNNITINSSNSGGTVTSVSVVPTNGFSGTVANATTTPAITLSTTISGLLQGSSGALAAYVGGSLVEATSSVLTIGNGANAVIGTGTTIQVKQATTSQSGYLSSTDWNTFNGKQAAGNYITALTGDVTASGPGSVAATVTRINGTSLAGLATGILKNTTTTGVPSIAIAADFPTLNQNTTGNAATVTTNANLTGPVTSVGNATSVTNNAITLAMMAQAPTLTIQGNNTGGTANVLNLTVAQVNAILPVFTSTLNGLAPLSGGGTTNFLRADGTWAAPTGSSGVTTVGAFSGSSQANGATIASTTITFGPADATNPGMVSTGTQTIAGAKTFNSALTLTQITTPASPSATHDSLYFKSDDNLYILNSAGVETLVAISGSTNYFTGFQNTNSVGWGASGVIGDPPGISGATLTTVLSNGLGTVTQALDGSSHPLPGLVFTPTVSGLYEISATFVGILNSAANAAGYALTDGTNFYDGWQFQASSGTLDESGTLKALANLTSGTPYTFKIQMGSTGGTAFVGGTSSNNFPGKPGDISWRINNTLSSGAGGGGANTALSNLITTAINADLIPAVSLNNNLGSTTSSWNTVYSSVLSATSTNNLSILTTALTSSASNSQPINLNSGNVSGSGTGATGGVSINSGAISNASSTNSTGSASLSSGTTSGSGTTGNVSVTSGNSSTGSSGTSGLTSGNASGSGKASGVVTVSSGAGTSGANSGNVNITAGAITGGGTRGDVNLTSQNIVMTAAGLISLFSGQRVQFRAVTTTYTLDSSAPDYVVFGNSTSAFTITLPAVLSGRTVVIKNINTGAVTISPASGTIDGSASAVLSVRYTSLTLVSDGANWFII